MLVKSPVMSEMEFQRLSDALIKQANLNTNMLKSEKAEHIAPLELWVISLEVLTYTRYNMHLGVCVDLHSPLLQNHPGSSGI